VQIPRTVPRTGLDVTELDGTSQGGLVVVIRRLRVKTSFKD
jgi:hypothetical protein